MMKCIFCEVCSGSIKGDIVLDRKYSMAFRDISPQAPVHVLVVPKKHLVNLLEFNEEDARILTDIFSTIQEVARVEKVLDSGFRVVSNVGLDGGQSVDHVHFHVLGGRPLHWPPG